MAQRRDARGRFAGGGGGGGGKKGGGKKAAGMKNQVAAGRAAKAKYKAATSQARQAKMLAGGRTSTRGLGKRTDAGAKNIRSNVKAYQSAAAKVRRMESKRGTSASRPAPKASTATSKKGKAAGGTKARKPSFKPTRKGATAASTVSEQAALARLGSGRKLRGKGSNPTARAERVLERGLSGTGKRARKSEATAKRAIDYMASQGTLGKRGKRRKA